MSPGKLKTLKNATDEMCHRTLSEGITENASPWLRRTCPGAAVASLWFWHRRRSDEVRNCSPTNRLDLAPAGDGAVAAGVDLNPRPVIVACTCSSRSHDVSHDVRAALFTRRAEPDANTRTQRLPNIGGVEMAHREVCDWRLCFAH